MSVAYDIALADQRIREMQARLHEQKARLQRRTVEGFPTQTLEDSVHTMEGRLQELQESRRRVGVRAALHRDLQTR